MNSKMNGQWFLQRMAAMCAVCLALLIGLSGCGSAGTKADMGITHEMVTEESMLETSDKDAGLMEEGSSVSQTADVSRKLIKTVDMDVETKEFDTLVDALTAQIASCGGYVERMNTYNGSIYSNRSSARSCSMTIRIPQDKLDTFLGTVTQISNVIRRNDSVEDVTLTYVDLESHKESLQTEQKRLLELLENAKSLEDIITIEERLSEVRYQIESMESQLRTYDNLVSYSTIYLSIAEVKELTQVAEETVWDRISGGFIESLQDIGDDIVEIGIWMIVNSPYLVIWAVIIISGVLLIRRHSAKRKKTRKNMDTDNVASHNDKE